MGEPQVRCTECHRLQPNPQVLEPALAGHLLGRCQHLDCPSRKRKGKVLFTVES